MKSIRGMTGTVRAHPEEDRRTPVGDYVLVELDTQDPGNGIAIPGITGRCLWVDPGLIEESK